MFNHRRLWSLLLVAAALPFSGCLSSPSLTSIVISPSTVTVSLVPPGVPQGFSQYSAIGYYTHPGHAPETQDITSQVIWSSSEPQVATINNTGIATATGFTSTGAWIGLSDITASMQGFNGDVVSNTSTFNVTACTACTTESPEPIVSVTIVPATQTVSVPGQTGQFIALGITGTGLQVNLTNTVGWNSSAPSVATINSSGLVTAKGQGSATITALATNPDGSVVAGTATFTVTNSSGAPAEPISSVSIIPSSQSVASPGGTGQFIAIGTSGTTGLQSDITNQVAWNSSSTSVATISATGLATGVSQGTTAITAIATNPDRSVVTGSAAFTVTGKAGAAPEPIASISIIPSNLTVGAPGETGQFIAIGTSGITGLQSNLTTSVTWSSSTVGVATIGANTGLATGVGQGVTAITAIAKNLDGSVVTGTATFTVTNAAGAPPEPIASLSIIPTNQAAATPGGSGEFIAIATSGFTSLQSNVTSQVTWSSSATGIATVTPAGVATGVGQGTAAITAQAKNPDGSVVTASAAFTVTNPAGAPPEPIASLTIIPSSLSVAKPGATGQFIAIATSGVTGVQSNVTTSVVWSSSTAGVGTIGASTGLATGEGQGTTAITAIATNPDGSVVTASASFSVVAPAPEPITALTISPNSESVALPGETGQFFALGTSGTTGLEVDLTNTAAWSSSNAKIAAVSSTGLVTGLAQGTSTITALVNNPDKSVVSATALFTVTNVASEPLTSLTIIPGSQSVQTPGQTSAFIAIGTTSSGATENLTNSVNWSSSDLAVATIQPTSGLATAVNQGTTAIIAVASNPDGSVVTGTATLTVIAGQSEPITALTIFPTSMSLSASGQSGNFVAIGTSGITGLQEDVTNSPQLVWTSSIPTFATITSYPTNPAGVATGKGAGDVTILAKWTNPDNSVVTATATVDVTSNPVPEPLLSLTIIPSEITVGQLQDTGNFLAIGTFSTSPQVRDLTQSVTWLSSLPNVFPVDTNTGGNTGATAGVVTAEGIGTAVIIAEATDATTGSIQTATATFSCPYLLPAPPQPGSCFIGSETSALLSTVTVYNEGLNTTNWLITAPSATGTPDVIHCGPGWTGAGGSVCSATYPIGTPITLTAPAGTGNFGGWSVDCTPNPNPPTAAGPNQCILTPTTFNETVGAIFN